MTRASLKTRAKLDSSIWRTLKQLQHLHYLKLDVTMMNLRGIEGLERLEELELTCKASDLTPIGRLPHLRTLVLDKCFNLLDLEPIAFMSLESLKISNCHGLTTLNDIRLMTTLKELIINGNNRILDTEFLKYLVHLKTLDLKDSNKLVLIDGMSDYLELEYLDISGSLVRGVKSIPQTIKILRMERCENLYSFRCISNVTQLDVCKCIGMRTLDLAIASELRTLDCSGSYSLSAIPGIQLAVNLFRLDLSGTAIPELDLVWLEKLSVLKIIDCIELTRLNLPSSLEELAIDGCTRLQDFNSIANTKLKTLSVSNTHITNLDFIRGLDIKSIVAMNCLGLCHVDLFDADLDFVNFRLCLNLLTVDGFKNLKTIDVTHCPLNIQGLRDSRVELI
ncbi:hypothetical protein HK103_006438 [Boothiomyces macroporosus]|uniref:Uncharacterized protein n=1 Tax=Boothiomyces macroporosus TaxID=261099 RepID=A0AAD5UL36_9FUNG|nr:hypothetical protein HK103_006438 [Boothiomyces macroporosus]